MPALYVYDYKMTVYVLLLRRTDATRKRNYH